MARSLVGMACSFVFMSSPALADLPPLDEARAANHCEEQWTKRGQLDQRMFDYCMERQREGFDQAARLERRYSDIEDMPNMIGYAVGKWLRAREYQYEMVAYEIEQQVDAFLNISFDMKAGKYTDEDVFACIQKWHSPDEPQGTMVEYCLRER